MVRREVLRALYLPWQWIVFMPFLAVWTIVMGLLCIALVFVSARVAFHCSTIWAWVLCRQAPGINLQPLVKAFENSLVFGGHKTSSCVSHVSHCVISLQETLRESFQLFFSVNR